MSQQQQWQPRSEAHATACEPINTVLWGREKKHKQNVPAQKCSGLQLR